MRRVGLSILACAVAGLAASGAHAATPRIVGGSDAPIAAVPWQIAVDTDTGNGDYFCGGALVDAKHVLTAAHCALAGNTPGSTTLAPSAISVLAGSSHLDPADSTGVQAVVSSVVADPMYDGVNYDAAILTLSQPLPLRGPIAAISLATAAPATGAPLTVSGWGLTSETAQDTSNTLQLTLVNATDFAQCQRNYSAQGVGLIATAVICAAGVRPARDACDGDSGGPLVDSSGTLVGIVASGIGCAEAAFPGVYTSVANPEVRRFIAEQTSAHPPLPPQLTAAPSLTGSAQAGSVLTCDEGEWSGGPNFTFTFADHSSPSTVLQTGGFNTLALSRADVGRTIDCRVLARNTTAAASAVSNSLGPVVAAPQAAVSQTADVTPPRTEIASKKCTPARCTIVVRVFDGGLTSGVARVVATIRTTTAKTCVLAPRRSALSHACTRATMRTSTARRVKGGDYAIVANHLPYGTQHFSIVATDRAGNRQLTPTLATARTTRARRR